MNIWQVSAGDSRRDFSNLFLTYDLMLTGPGRFGPYNDGVYNKIIEQGLYSNKKIKIIKTFAEKVEPGDIVLLRDGNKFKAIGKAADEAYLHDEIFDDIFGWDLQHCRRVFWQEHLKDELEQLDLEWGSGKATSMFSGVNKTEISNKVKPLVDKFKTRKLRLLPSGTGRTLTLEELGEELFSRGLPNNSVDQLVKSIERQRRLIRWYDLHGKKSDRPTEHEIVAHMVLPLLLSLGWSEQLLGVEWNRVDLAVFSDAPTTAKNCCLVCESKRFGHGLQSAFKQAVGYVNKLKMSKCEKILLTEGKRLYIFEKSGTVWAEKDKPVGYLNINKIRTHYLVPEGTNAIDTIMSLTPAGIHRKIGK